MRRLRCFTQAASLSRRFATASKVPETSTTLDTFAAPDLRKAFEDIRRYAMDPSTEYRQLPDDALFITLYVPQLVEFRLFLRQLSPAKSHFSDYSALDLARALLRFMETARSKHTTHDGFLTDSTTKGLLEREYRSLERMALGVRRTIMVTNGHTTLLDAVIENDEAFLAMENRLRDKPKPPASLLDSLLEAPKVGGSLGHILKKRLNPGATEKPQRRVAPSPDPFEHLTVEAIRKPYQYQASSSKSESKPKAQAALGIEEDLQGFLRQVQQVKENDRNTQTRHQKAYTWMKSHPPPPSFLEPQTVYREHVVGAFTRATQRDLFFPATHNPSPQNALSLGEKTLAAPLALERLDPREYLLLAENGTTIAAFANPLGAAHVPEEMFSIFSRLAYPERYVQHIERLQARNWKLIGGGGPELVLVFERPREPTTLLPNRARWLYWGLAGGAVAAYWAYLHQRPRQPLNPVS